MLRMLLSNVLHIHVQRYKNKGKCRYQLVAKVGEAASLD